MKIPAETSREKALGKMACKMSALHSSFRVFGVFRGWLCVLGVSVVNILHKSFEKTMAKHAGNRLDHTYFCRTPRIVH